MRTLSSFPLLYLWLASALWLTACGGLPQASPGSAWGRPAPRAPADPARQAMANDVVMYALGLVDTGYRFGGKNPEAGLDCSGMVSYIFAQAAAIKTQGSAADIALQASPVDPAQLRPGDLVFFNTSGKPFSHVGIYIGDQRFVHAPSSRGQARVRTESMRSSYFAARFEAARSLLE